MVFLETVYVLFLSLLSPSSVLGDQSVSPELSIVYGPGLASGVATPSRYIFIQAVDTHGENFSTSPGLGAFSVDIRMNKHGKHYQMQVTAYDRGDGSLSYRYFFNDVPESITIRIEHHGRSVGSSPYVLRKPLPELCSCPRNDAKDFAAAYQCPSTFPQLHQDLRALKGRGGVTRSLLQEALSELNNGKNCFVHYAVLGNKLYSKQYGPFPGFQTFVNDILLSLARKVRLPDVEFIFNLGDWPLAHGPTAEKFPVISWCGSVAPNSTSDVVVPTYKQILGTVFGKDFESAPDVDGQCTSVGAPWHQKIEKALFRGRDSHPMRVAAMTGPAKDHPDLVDARISQNHMNYFPDESAKLAHHAFEAKYGSKAKRINFYAFWKWKYLLSIDGTVAAYRFPALLAGNSVLLKQDSLWYENFYRELIPWVHYIPVKKDLSDLVEQVQWAKLHDEQAQQISRNGRLYARQNLTQASVYCYYFRTLQGYAELQDFTPTRTAEMKAVQDDKEISCDCSAATHMKKRRKKKKKNKQENLHHTEL